MQSSETKTTEISVSAGLGINTVSSVQLSAQPLGVGAAVTRDFGVRSGIEGSYDTSSMTSTSLSVASGTTLITNFGTTAGSSKQYFGVTPYFYYANTGILEIRGQ